MIAKNKYIIKVDNKVDELKDRIYKIVNSLMEEF